MKDYILEACVDSVESALAAAEGGATRLELCSNLIIGGTTPSPWLFKEIRKHTDIRIHALIRPRFGDFCYTDSEFAIIKQAVADFRELGAEGVVIGILKPDGTLNMEQMKELMDAAGEMSVTLHRAFDVCVDPYETMEAGSRTRDDSPHPLRRTEIHGCHWRKSPERRKRIFYTGTQQLPSVIRRMRYLGRIHRRRFENSPSFESICQGILPTGSPSEPRNHFAPVH